MTHTYLIKSTDQAIIVWIQTNKTTFQLRNKQSRQNPCLIYKMIFFGDFLPPQKHCLSILPQFKLAPAHSSMSNKSARACKHTLQLWECNCPRLWNKNKSHLPETHVLYHSILRLWITSVGRKDKPVEFPAQDNLVATSFYHLGAAVVFNITCNLWNPTSRAPRGSWGDQERPNREHDGQEGNICFPEKSIKVHAWLEMGISHQKAPEAQRTVEHSASPCCSDKLWSNRKNFHLITQTLLKPGNLITNCFTICR